MSPDKIPSSRRNDLANESGLRSLGEEIAGRPQQRGSKRRRSRRQRLTITIGVTLSLVIILFFGGFGYLRFRFDQLTKFHIGGLTQEANGQPFNVLVVGSDSRTGLTGEMAAQAGASQFVGGQRSDVTMIWHVNPVEKTVQIVSIPRDTLVSLSATPKLANTYGRFNRINSALDGGPAGLAKVITANFGIPISHVAQVNFAGFAGAVDSIGGVKLNFPYPARDAFSGLNISQTGCQLLNGGNALAVARSRHYEYYAHGYWQGDGSSDFGRITRQGAFLRSIVATAKSKANPLTINAFLGSIPAGVIIDDKWSLKDLVNLALDYRSIDPQTIVTQTMPTDYKGYVGPWGDVLFASQPSTQEMLSSIFASSLERPTFPAPNPALQTPQPSSLTTTTAKPPPTSKGHGSSTTAPVTTTTTAIPSFDPTPC